MKSNISSLYPSIYKDVLETDILSKVGDYQFNNFYNEADNAFNNQFVLTADIKGIEAFEKLYYIIANPAMEDLEFRRLRVLSRMTTAPPFSIRMLRQRLDVMIGVDKYKAWADNNSYTLYIEAVSENSAWYQEVSIFVNRIKPANIIYILVPLISSGIAMSEEILIRKTRWNYKLNGMWKLGQDPFAFAEPMQWQYKLGGQWHLGETPFAIDDPEVIKMGDVPSLTQDFLNSHAIHSSQKITGILLNNTAQINIFTEKTTIGADTLLEYAVPSELGVNEITNIKLLGDNDVVLSNATVYIPFADGLSIKHKINHREDI